MRETRARRFRCRGCALANRLAVLALTVFVFASCAGSGGLPGSPGAMQPVFYSSGAALAPDLVRLTGGPFTSGQLQLTVTIGGPTTSTDIVGFAFDLVFSDPYLVQVLAVAPGNALGGNVMLLPQQPAIHDGRLTVGIVKTAPAAGMQIGAPESTVVTVLLKTMKKGTSTVRFENAAACDSAHADTCQQNPIPSITFDAGAGTITQN